MRADAVIYVNGAFILGYVTNGRATPRPVWTIGNLTLTPSTLELGDRSGKRALRLATVRSVGAPPATMLPPPVSMEQVLALEHVEEGVTMTSMIAFPSVTVNNFPMQLAGALTGTVNAFLPVVAAQGGAARYEPATFEFDVDRFRIRTRAGEQQLLFQDLASVSPARRRDAQGRELVEWSLDISTSKGIQTTNVLSYERVAFLYPLLLSVQSLRRNSALGGGSRPSDMLSETAQQVATLLYTGGVTLASIEQMLGVSADKVDSAYEELLRAGLADVVKVRKEIALNPAGMRAVDEIMKKQLETPTL